MSRSSNSESCSGPPSAGERLDRRRAERGDPVEAGGRDIGVDARLSDDAAVADEHDALQPKPHAQLLDLTGEGARVAEVAFEHLDGDRAAVRRARSPKTICGRSGR